MRRSLLWSAERSAGRIHLSGVVIGRDTMQSLCIQIPCEWPRPLPSEMQPEYMMHDYHPLPIDQDNDPASTCNRPRSF